MAKRQRKPVVVPEGPPPDPWEMQPKETAASFAGFQVYRDTPALERSLQRVCSDIGRAFSVVSLWSAKHGWGERVKAWDRHLDVVRQQEQIQEAIDMGRRQARMAAQFQSALAVPTAALLQRMQRPPAEDDPDRRTELERMADEDPQRLLALVAMTAKSFPAMAQLERLARGFSTEHIEVTQSLEDSTDGQLKAQPQRSLERIASILSAAKETGQLPPDFIVPQLPPGDTT